MIMRVKLLRVYMLLLKATFTQIQFFIALVSIIVGFGQSLPLYDLLIESFTVFYNLNFIDF